MFAVLFLVVLVILNSLFGCVCQPMIDEYDDDDDDVVEAWLGGVVVRALDLRSVGRGFDSRPLHCQATTLGKLFTPMCLEYFSKSIDFPIVQHCTTIVKLQ